MPRRRQPFNPETVCRAGTRRRWRASVRRRIRRWRRDPGPPPRAGRLTRQEPSGPGRPWATPRRCCACIRRGSGSGRREGEQPPKQPATRRMPAISHITCRMIRRPIHLEAESHRVPSDPVPLGKNTHLPAARSALRAGDLRFRLRSRLRLTGHRMERCGRGGSPRSLCGTPART
jgi:hypothetical protein